MEGRIARPVANTKHVLLEILLFEFPHGMWVATFRTKPKSLEEEVGGQRHFRLSLRTY